MTIKETPNKITAVLKVTATAEFFDDEASEETVRYAIEQDLEDAGFDVDVALLKEQEETIEELQNAYGYLQKQFFEAQDKLLKEQEAVEPETENAVYDIGTWWYICGA